MLNISLLASLTNKQDKILSDTFTLASAVTINANSILPIVNIPSSIVKPSTGLVLMFKTNYGNFWGDCMIGNYLNLTYYAVVRNPSTNALTIPAGTTITYYYILF